LEQAPLSGVAGAAEGAGEAGTTGAADIERAAGASNKASGADSAGIANSASNAGGIGKARGANGTQAASGASEQTSRTGRLSQPSQSGQPGRLAEIVRLCCAGKASYVERDERDTGDRMMLNFGHTFGHAIEKLHSYETYNHGEAVSIGMMMAVRAGALMGATDPAAAGELARLLDSAGLDGYRESFDMERLIPLMSGDKKNASDGGISLVLLKKFGSPFVARASQQELAELFRGKGGAWA
jgi:hypothetical protein